MSILFMALNFIILDNMFVFFLLVDFYTQTELNDQEDFSLGSGGYL